MIVMVTGSRDWRDREAIFSTLNRVHAKHGSAMRLIQGGAAGADRLAFEWAEAMNVKCETFSPDYSQPSPQRYHKRNDAMLDVANGVVAFWDGASRGTKSVIDKARLRELPLMLVRA